MHCLIRINICAHLLIHLDHAEDFCTSKILHPSLNLLFLHVGREHTNRGLCMWSLWESREKQVCDALSSTALHYIHRPWTFYCVGCLIELVWWWWGIFNAYSTHMSLCRK